MATKQQIPKVAATLVEFQEAFEGLSNDDAQWIIQHGKEANELFVDLIKNGKKDNVLSDALASRAVSLRGATFSIRDNFSSSNPKVKFVQVSSKLLDWADESSEDNKCQKSKRIYSRRVRRKHNKDKDSIIYELGDIQKAKVSLREIYHLLFDEEVYTLLGNEEFISKKTSNKFIISRANGDLGVVVINWFNDGWRVNVYRLGFAMAFFDPGDIVFSHEQ